MPDKYTKEVKKLLPEKTIFGKDADGIEIIISAGDIQEVGYNYAIDDCTPIVADLLKQIDELKEKLKGEGR